jgi:ribosome-binding factor A
MTRRQESPRARRVADRIQVEIAEMLQRKARDPRLQTLSVTGVTVTRDLTSARVWVTGRFPEGQEDAVLRALSHATPFLRTLLAPRLQLRVVPTLQFQFDRSLETGARIEQLLREIKEPPKDSAE